MEAFSVLDKAGSDDARMRAAMAAAGAARETAAQARARAAEDRRRAAADREAAAADRTRAAVELEQAHLDDLTGAFRRGVGMVAIAQEVERAHRAKVPLVMAYIDIDGLKRVNDRSGHEAGDAVLRAVASALRDNLRPYDPLVRMGGDEFVCLVSNTELDEAGARFREIADGLVRDAGSSISVGLVELRDEETLEQLLHRGDQAMYAAKPAGL